VYNTSEEIMNFKTSMMAVLASLAMIGSAGATTTTYVNAAALAQNSSNMSTVNFEGLGNSIQDATVLAVGGVTFGAAAIFTMVDLGYDADYHTSTYLNLQQVPQLPNSLSMSFAAPITALGFDFGAVYNQQLALAITIDGIEYLVTADAGEYGFFGITTDTAFSSLTISSDSDFTAFDNVSFGAVRTDNPGQVPEPASLALLGLGLLGVAAARRKGRAVV
jgi:hypothetical protein